ncbi:Calmodulin [Symbiodinium natans]|uniref:Calmodulin protein n=1 Tax=Symbiodinium natans TaxID=878477 RepID=A0A812U5K5_9DINO|nr:Calmodulin [Symbiodinium natans]
MKLPCVLMIRALLVTGSGTSIERRNPGSPKPWPPLAIPNKSEKGVLHLTLAGLKKEDLLPFMVDIGTAPPNTEEMQPPGFTRNSGGGVCGSSHRQSLKCFPQFQLRVFANHTFDSGACLYWTSSKSSPGRTRNFPMLGSISLHVHYMNGRDIVCELVLGCYQSLVARPSVSTVCVFCTTR